MTWLILLFTLGSGVSVWYTVRTYVETARAADLFEAAQRQERRIEILAGQWNSRVSTPWQREAVGNWYREELEHTLFRGASSVSAILNGTWENAGLSPERAAYNSRQAKKTASLHNGLGGVSGVVAGVLGLFR